MEIEEFLLARIAEDEAAARATADAAAQLDADFEVEDPGNWSRWSRPFASVSYQGPIADFVESQTPARVLAECEAKRRIVELRCHEWVTAGGSPLPFAAVYQNRDGVLQSLALPYADHPDYRAEWAPEVTAGR